MARRIVILLVCFVIALSALGQNVRPARAATLIVNTTADNTIPADTFCTLREAITTINTGTANDCGTGASGDTISFSVSGTITLTAPAGGPMVINQNMTIDGTGQAVTIDGANNFQVFFVNAGFTFTLNDVTVAHGTSVLGGGGLLNQGTVNITNSTFSANTATTIIGNCCGGGGLLNQGTVNITNSTFSGNLAPNGNVGGLFNQGTVNIANSTFSGNSAAGGGGGLANGGIANIANSTFSGNSSGSIGGGGIITALGTLNVVNSTFSGNSTAAVGGGIYVGAGTANVQNTIITNSPAGGDCSNAGTLNATNNLSGSAICASADVTSFNTTLANNGGPTQTHVLLTGSNAINAVTDCTYPAAFTAAIFSPGAGNTIPTDQRGIARPQGTACDIGAFESQSLAPTISKAFAPSTVAVGNPSTLTFTISNPNAPTALTNAAFSDTLPLVGGNQMVVATPNGLTPLTGCTGTVTATAGGSSISFTGGTLTAATCTFSVNVTAPAAGTYPNTTSVVTSNEINGTTTGSASLQVNNSLTLGKAFSPAAIGVGGVSTLTFTISNPASGFASLSNLSFNDTMPTGLVIVASPAPSTTCGGPPTLTATAGTKLISFAGGTLSGAPASCTITVGVKADGTATGSLTNTSGALSSTETGITGSTAIANLTVGVPSSPAPSFPQSPAVPLCNLLNGTPLPYIRASVRPGTAIAPNGVEAAVFCGPLFDPVQYGVLDRQVLHAVEVFALTPNGPAISVTVFRFPVLVCLQGVGAMLYRDANTATGQKRVVVELPSWVENGFTCVNLPNAGTLILVTGQPAQTNAPAASGPVKALDICEVTTNAIVNLRAEPSANGKVLDRVPFKTTLKATARQNGFFQVVYGSNQGWVSAQFVTTDGQCGA